ncbi:hypothetical protein V9T40_011871 [Parthenolecanium corni]|uniref:Uncharacterized protein n=1 Tax=Parthenolecanium corni TaxID=536013 RepID=A0AAN9T6U1_9HEMI
MGCWHWRFHSVPSRRSRKHGSLFRAPQFRKEPTIFIRSPECTPKLSEQDDIIVKYTHAFASDRDTIHRPNIQHPRIYRAIAFVVFELPSSPFSMKIAQLAAWTYNNNNERATNEMKPMGSSTHLPSSSSIPRCKPCLSFGKQTTSVSKLARLQ